MERSLCLLVIVCVFIGLGEAHPPRRQGARWRPWQANIPSGIREICGSSTSRRLANDVFEAFTKASDHAIGQRNEAWGWTPEPFLSTARAIMNLQLSTGAEWYGQESMDERRWMGFFGRWNSQEEERDLTKDLSVKQLEVEVLTYLTRYLSGEDSLQLMGHTEFASHLVALSLTCHNIFDFYGFNLYRVMNERLQRYGDGVTAAIRPGSGPAPSASCDSIIPGGAANRDFFYGFGLLLTCQNVDEISPDFVRCIIEAQNNGLYAEPLVIPGLGSYPLGYGDLQLLGMSCLRDRVPAQYKDEYSAVMERIAQWMIDMQVADGSFAENPIATALAIQTLKSAEASFDSRDCEAAIRNLLTFQDDEGVVAGLTGVTMLAMTTLAGESMAYLDEIEPECNRPY